MMFLFYYLGLVAFALNGLIFLGRYNQDKCAKLIILEHMRERKTRRRRR